MKTWDEVIKKALEMHLHSDSYAYFYGAKGQVLTDKVMDALWAAEPAYFSKYDATEKKRIYNFSRGKIGYDCSGFIGAVTGYMAPSKYQIEACTKRSTDLASGVAGSLLYMPGHIGIDIGYGFFLHMPKEGYSVELGRIKEGVVKWTQCGRLTSYIDYKGANNR